MNDRIYRNTIRVSGDAVNMALELRSSEMFLLFQEAAGDHAIKLGVGQPFLMERGYTWVVALMNVEIARLPKYDETIAVETWPGPFRRILCPRWYQIRVLPKTEEERALRPDGEVVVRAMAVWSILDVEKRVAVNPVAEGLVADPSAWSLTEEDAGPDERLTMAMNRPRAIRMGNPGNRSEFTVPFSYVDMNGHMNNTRYLDLAENLLFADRLKADAEGTKTAEADGTAVPARFTVPELTRIEAEYRAELIGGETVPVLWGEEPRADGAEERAFCFQGGDANPAFRLRMAYRERRG